MSEYLDVIIFIAVMWVLAGLKWWFINKNHKERRLLGQASHPRLDTWELLIDTYLS